MSARPAAPPSSSVSEISSLPVGWQPVSRAILADGTLAVLGADVDLDSEHRRIHAALLASVAPDPPSRIRELAASATARIWIAGPTGWTGGPTFPLETPFPIIDRFGDGRWLVVGARTSVGPNARVLSADGTVLGRFMLGDGIEHVVIDQSNCIWVAWFDEGVFGNEDWRIPGQEWPPANNGVACFAEDGALLELPIWPDEMGSVADCYALNTIGDGSWSCPYLDFPLVHCVPGKPIRWWRNGVTAPEAIAIDGSYVLLAGGYTGEANRLALVSLVGAGGGEHTQEIASWSLPMRPRTAANEWEPVWEHPTLLVGRGDAIHLVDNDVWRVWRVADLASPSETT
jgi:hypothetical protein